jgi:capsular exopolysaccharide synthesis family protein
MSIVEKVVSREAKSKRSLERAEAVSADVRSQTAASDELPPSGCIALSNLTERGQISILEDPDLSRAFRFVKRAVLAKIFDRAVKGQEPGKVVMITSAMPSAGKSFMAFNLAVSIAQEQLINVVLIDADPVRHKLSSVLGLRDAPGLLEILQNRNINNGALPTDLPGLRFVPAGKAHDNSTELLASAHMSEVLANFTENDTVAVIDTTPLLISGEADAISAHADHTIVMVEAGNTSVDEIESVLQILKKSGSSVNFILNKLKSVNFSDVPYYLYESY